MRENNKYSFESVIRFSEADHTKRITLPGIINYFQDCSIFQSEALGHGIDYLAVHKKAWVLSSWQVVVKRYPRLTEKIRVSSWATGFKGMLGDRNFCMEDKNGQILAYANSQWVYMDIEKGRPVKPDEREVEAYGTGRAIEMEYAPRKIALPENLTEFPAFPVRRYHIDTNEHVNNCQYIQMAMEMLEGEKRICRMRAEYKRSAVYKDIIVPKAAEEEGRTVVELGSTEGKAYAVVEFQYE